MKGVPNPNRILKEAGIKRIKRAMGFKKVRGKALKQINTKHVRAAGR